MLYRLLSRLTPSSRTTAANDYTMRVLEQVAEGGSTDMTLRHSIQTVHPSGAETLILRTFGEVMNTLTMETERTLLAASVCAVNLEQLQEHLLTIHEICLREGFTLSEAHAELLSELWSILGGNRHARRTNERHLALLRAVGRYRAEALAHVIATRDTLQALSADIEELRDRSATPGIAVEGISIQVMIQSIDNGIRRLQECRQRARERQQMLIGRLLATSDDTSPVMDERLLV